MVRRRDLKNHQQRHHSGNDSQNRGSRVQALCVKHHRAAQHNLKGKRVECGKPKGVIQAGRKRNFFSLSFQGPAQPWPPFEGMNARLTRLLFIRGSHSKTASSSLLSPSLPSDGGEGWGEEARSCRFPLSLVLSPLVPRRERMVSLTQPCLPITWREGLLPIACCSGIPPNPADPNSRNKNKRDND